MIFHHDPCEWVHESSFTVCDFHKKNPGVSYAGCCCGGFFSSRRATPKEEAENRERAKLGQKPTHHFALK